MKIQYLLPVTKANPQITTFTSKARWWSIQALFACIALMVGASFQQVYGQCTGEVLNISAPTPGQAPATGTWTVHSGGPYMVKITAKGAKGGAFHDVPGGDGATMIGNFVVNSGQIISATAGSEGKSENGNPLQPSGGSGSFASVIGGSLLITAGGGSSSYSFFGVPYPGQPGLVTPNGGDGLPNPGYNGYPGVGGINGGDGTNGVNFSSISLGGKGIFNGAIGGQGTIGNQGAAGGQGGGGYSGGGGGHLNAGGGGGSINFGANQINTSGSNSGGGQVIIECLGPVTFAASFIPTQPTCADLSQGSLSIDLTSDINGNTAGLEYAIVAGNNFSGTPDFSDITADPFNINSGLGTEASPGGSTYTVRIRLKYNPEIYLDNTYTLTSGCSCERIFVNQNATGLNNGASWANAFTDLQHALAVACDGAEIWVAAGAYKPTSGTDRGISFSMKNDVAIYGGFNGTETMLSQRNWAMNVTTLSGDIGVQGDNSDNSYHVIYNDNNGLTNSSILDGFSITAGNANGVHEFFTDAGGGIYNAQVSPMIRNCIIINNESAKGGGVFNRLNAFPFFINCVLTENFGVQGGGMYNIFNCSSTIINCTFSENSSYYGGAITNWLSSSTIFNSILWSNMNGEIANDPSSTTNVTNSIVSGGYPGAGNLNYNPLFVNPAIGNFRLQGLSPAINSGNNAALPIGITSDLDGNPRFYSNGTVDMGAYEFQGEPTPVVANCQNQILALDANGNSTISAQAFSNNSSGYGVLSFMVDGNSSLFYNCSNIGSNPITLTVTDQRGLSATCTATVTVEDNISPTALCQDITVQLDENGSFSISPMGSIYSLGSVSGEMANQNTGSPGPDAFCDCPENYVAVGYEGFQGCIIDDFRLLCRELMPNGTLGAGLAVTCSSGTYNGGFLRMLSGNQILVGFSVSDANFQYQGNNTRTHLSFTGYGRELTDIANGADNSIDNVIAESLQGGGCFSSSPLNTVQYAPAGHAIVGMSYFAGSGYSSVLRFRYAPINQISIDNGSFDACGIQSLSVSQTEFNCSNFGSNPVTLTVTDVNGNTNICSAIVTVEDNISPSFVCPADQDVNLNPACQLEIPDLITGLEGSDNCGSVSFIQNPSEGTLIASSHNGTITVTITASDGSGNSSNCNVTLTGKDVTQPAFICPSNQDVDLNTSCQLIIPDLITGLVGTDNCGSVSFMQNPAAGTSMASSHNAAVIVSISASDENGNSSTCNVTLTSKDLIAPTIECPANMMVNTDPGQCNAAVQYIAPIGIDNCSGATTIRTSGPASGAIFPVGQTSIIHVVTDVAGNAAGCSFTISVIDAEAPILQCFNQTINFNGETSIPLNPNDLAEAADNCGVQTINLSPASVSSAQVGQTVPVLVTVTDINGNAATCISQVSVSGLPPGWSQNINGVGCADGNDINYNPSTQIWTATSTNCYYASPFTSDALGFAQRTLCGDGSITAQVTGISGNALGWAGVVMRENNASGAKKAQLTTNMSGNQSRREFRLTTNGTAMPQNFPAQNRFWLRIERSGNQFIMYHSPNGAQWFLIGAQNIAMNSCIEIGLVATNYTQNSTVTSTFANVSFTGNGPMMQASNPENIHFAVSADIQPDFSVYPNPTSGELNIDLKEYTGKNVRIELYSPEGKLMQSIQLDAVLQNTQTLQLDRYAAGMYFVKLKSAGLPDVTKRVVLTKN